MSLDAACEAVKPLLRKEKSGSFVYIGEYFDEYQEIFADTLRMEGDKYTFCGRAIEFVDEILEHTGELLEENLYEHAALILGYATSGCAIAKNLVESMNIEGETITEWMYNLTEHAKKVNHTIETYIRQNPELKQYVKEVL